MIKAIIFDLGGVIFNANINSDYLSLCKKYNIQNTTNLFDAFRVEWDKAKVSEISCDEFYESIAKKIRAKPREIRSVFVDHIDLNEQMRDLVLALKETYKIGILTNTIEDLYNATLQVWNFEDIAEVITSFKEHVAKPSEEAITLMLKKLGVEKEEVVFIDDHEDTIKKYSDLAIACILFEGYEKLITKLEKVGIKI